MPFDLPSEAMCPSPISLAYSAGGISTTPSGIPRVPSFGKKAKVWFQHKHGRLTVSSGHPTMCDRTAASGAFSLDDAGMGTFASLDSAERVRAADDGYGVVRNVLHAIEKRDALAIML
jgi:hypothetical protein